MMLGNNCLTDNKFFLKTQATNYIILKLFKKQNLLIIITVNKWGQSNRSLMNLPVSWFKDRPYEEVLYVANM